MKNILLLIAGTIVIAAKEFVKVVRNTDLMLRLFPYDEQKRMDRWNNFMMGL